MIKLPDDADRGAGLKRESKRGLAVQFVLSVLATAALGWLGTVKLDSTPGWATAALALAASTAAGYLTAWKTKNDPLPVS